MEVKKIEEILEEIWIQRERGNSGAEISSCSGEKITDEDMRIIEEAGYIKRKEGKIILTDKGEALASQVIRGHRLAERLMTDVLAISSSQMESNACNFEHVIQHEVADAICTLLGHPAECPHGRKIPSGACCVNAKSNLESVVMPADKLLAGSRAKIAYVSARHHERLDRLASLGILPGAQVTLHQTRPSYILQIGHAQVALDKEILKDIYVRRLA